MKMIYIIRTALVSFSLATAAAAPSEALKTALQKGFFEEEASQNIPAAMEAYQSILRQFDEDRKIAGSAMFRLAECYRKLGQTNEAAAWYQRAVRDSGDEVLKRLSQQNLAALGRAAEGSAASGGDEEAEEIRRYQALLQGNPDLLNALNEKNRSPLHEAVVAGREALVKFLLESGADPDRKGSGGMTALHYAANMGYKSIAEILLGHKAGIDETDGEKWTPLHYAAAKGHRAVCELLLARGADLQAVARSWASGTPSPRSSLWGGSPLHLAVEHGNIRIVELLLQRGANVNALERVTPLMIAVDTGSLRLARMLLEAKADPNLPDAEGRSPLHYATAGRHEAIMEELLKRGAKANPVTKQGETPLFIALESPAMIRMLLEHGANPNAIFQVSGTNRGETPLDRAQNRLINNRSNERYYRESIELLKAAGGKTFAEMPGTQTELNGAAGRARPERAESENKDVLFLGEVKASAHKMEPGQRDSLFEILVGKIGLTPEADLGRVVVNRIDPVTGQNTNILVNLNAVKNGDRTKDMELRSGDRVTVKKSLF